ncbi:MAG: HEAT repeat domain-containing protein [Pseudoxanthomonas sp.]
MNRTIKFISIQLCALIVFSGCSEPAALGHINTNDSYQGIREQIIQDFFRDPAAAGENYRSVFSLPSTPERKYLAAKIVVCGQLKAKELEVESSCQARINEGLKESNEEIRSLAISALAYSIDDSAQSILIAALADRSTIVKIEAAQALNYQLVTLSSDPNNPEASKQLRSKLLEFCQSKRTDATSASDELCEKI